MTNLIVAFELEGLVVTWVRYMCWRSLQLHWNKYMCWGVLRLHWIWYRCWGVLWLYWIWYMHWRILRLYWIWDVHWRVWYMHWKVWWWGPGMCTGKFGTGGESGMWLEDLGQEGWEDLGLVPCP